MSLSEERALRRYENGHMADAVVLVPREALVRLHVNGREWAAIMATPEQLDLLVLGFLRSEGIISSPAGIRRVVVCPSHTCVEVWLADSAIEPPAVRVLTSGCGGGITFSDMTEGIVPIQSALRASPAQLGRLLARLQEGQRTRGVHTAGLADGEELLAVVEDVGRHNTIDKLWGKCMVQGIATEGRILLSTGRISSEMLNKAARMGVPLVASRTAPTTLSVALAEAWGLTLVGYVRRMAGLGP
jgi:FdhD protein